LRAFASYIPVKPIKSTNLSLFCSEHRDTYINYYLHIMLD
jgi:hypothetical protein